MNSSIAAAIKHSYDRISLLARRLYRMDFNATNEPSILRIVSNELNNQGYDSIFEDDIGNLIGVLRGEGGDGDILLLSTIDGSAYSRINPYQGRKPLGTRAGIVCGTMAGAILRHAGVGLKSDLIFCCIPSAASSGIGIKHLFETFLKNRNVRLVILCEPTNCNLFIGNRGKIQYEIVVRFNSCGADAPTGTSALTPLAERLTAIGNTLPRDLDLGNSSLLIKDTAWEYSTLGTSIDLHMLIERTYLPQENPMTILSRAHSITEAIYQKCRPLCIRTALIKKSVVTKNGSSLEYEDDLLPWKLPLSSPHVYSSLEILNENRIKSSVGCWQNTVTNGSYTYGILNIPTIGFGAGSEEGADQASYRPPYFSELLSSIYGMSLIIHHQMKNPA